MAQKEFIRREGPRNAAILLKAIFVLFCVVENRIPQNRLPHPLYLFFTKERLRHKVEQGTQL